MDTNKVFSPPVVSVGEQVRAARQRLEKTQAEIATEANVSRVLVNSLENGEATGISYAFLCRIMNAVGLRFEMRHAERPVLEDLLLDRDQLFIDDSKQRPRG